ncbi:hypothetical protein [Fructilactobacillus fructivorans]|uniref:hypothetical protein n=1 Tax=Fructilactobacillus fructivorans TaxID=1614 RepID=UPI0002196CF6|nr:hypothetical protein [Fructilactobacillus fructivorans]KRK58205.1 hypothetical protein FC73_GL000586 [Fructilactobacillus fructivorans]KRN12960.1 hypothetical protein IV37_GL000593 [Fructilactobacillus fructivorans]KRN40920.1 hypothetical protein IV51_GL001149 [Fructilactobacillus fructivorans]KRN42611.1 hypothetical protein IV48_GL001359 [Fructilactobacillus fructivorans]
MKNKISKKQAKELQRIQEHLMDPKNRKRINEEANKKVTDNPKVIKALKMLSKI